MNWKMRLWRLNVLGRRRHKTCWSCPCFIENVFTNLNNVLLQVITARTGYRGNYDCFHTRAKCAIWMIIRTAQFELHSVHTREVIAIFELRIVHERPNLRFSIPEREKMCGSCQGTLSIKHARSSRFLCFCILCSTWYRRKWLEGHIALPPPPPKKKNQIKSKFRGQGTRYGDFAAWFERCVTGNTSGPSFELRNSNYASRCNFAYTWSKIPSFEWSFKLCTLLSCKHSLSITRSFGPRNLVCHQISC